MVVYKAQNFVYVGLKLFDNNLLVLLTESSRL